MKKTDCGEQLHRHTYGNNVASLSTFRPAEKTSLVLTAPPTGEQRPDWVYCHCGGLTCLTTASLMMLMLILFPRWMTCDLRSNSATGSAGFLRYPGPEVHFLRDQGTGHGCSPPAPLSFSPFPSASLASQGCQVLSDVAAGLLLLNPPTPPHPLQNRSSLAYTWCHSSGVLGSFLVLILIPSSVLALQHRGRQCRGCCSVLGSSLIRAASAVEACWLLVTFCHRTSPSCCPPCPFSLSQSAALVPVAVEW